MATRNSGFFVQSHHGAAGNFEVVVPRIGSGLAYYWRDNDHPLRPWYGPFPTFASSAAIAAVAVMRSHLGSVSNLEVVAQEGNKLLYSSKGDGGIGGWQDPAVLPGAHMIVGAPTFIQSHHGSKGNFEVVAPAAGGGVAHWWRDNDAPDTPWHGPTFFGSGNVSAVAMIQSNFGSVGNLEVIARVGTQLEHYWRDDGGTQAWHGPFIIASGVTGNPAFIQSHHGSKGNFEVVAPAAGGGLAHWWRDNDAPDTPWHGPTFFGSGSVSAVGLLQNAAFGSASNLEVVVTAGSDLKHYWRDEGGTSTWHGPLTFGTLQGNSSSEGECTIPFGSGIVGIHAALLHTGKLVLFAYADFDDLVGESRVLDPVSGALQTPPHSHHLFCSGHAFLPDGRLLVAGGHHHEVAALHVFEPAEQHWTGVGAMEHGRWYPTCTTLPNGQIFIISGTKNGGPVGPDTPVNNTLQVYDAQARLEPEEPLPAPFSSHFPAHFTTIDLYPFVYALPSGTLLVHSRNTTRFYDPTVRMWEPTQLRTVSPFSRTYPGEGTSVLLPLLPTSNPPYRARVLIAGGGGVDTENLTQATPATDTAEILDLGASTPAWRSTKPMKFPRVMPDAVLLPDGAVLVVGGSATGRADLGIDPVLDIELFDPVSESWSTMCSMQVPRLYHSTAILLPDGRVLMLGKDGLYNPPPYNYPEHRGEIFSPPYLFRGPRPVIAAAPTVVDYNAPFVVDTPDAPRVAAVAFLSPGSVTHSFNMSQRYVGLTIVSRTSKQLIMQAPPHARIAPPGYYMLFLVSADGVPSVASFIRLPGPLPVG